MKSIRGEINGLSLLVLHSEGGESALGYHSLGQEFLEAAEKLVRQRLLPAVGTAESFLAGHGLELFLKSFLIARGVPAKDLRNRNKFGHHLRTCLNAAEELGLNKMLRISSGFRQRINILADEYFGKNLEYFQGTAVVSRPDLRGFLPDIRELCEALDQLYRMASRAAS